MFPPKLLKTDGCLFSDKRLVVKEIPQPCLEAQKQNVPLKRCFQESLNLGGRVVNGIILFLTLLPPTPWKLLPQSLLLSGILWIHLQILLRLRDSPGKILSVFRHRVQNKIRQYICKIVVYKSHLTVYYLFTKKWRRNYIQSNSLMNIHC